jgi:chromosome segregation ATPase
VNAPLQFVDPRVDLDATEELPVLDISAYEARLHSAAASESAESSARPPEPPVVAGRDTDELLSVEQWIAQKTTELRSLQDGLGRAQRDHRAAEERAVQMTRDLSEAGSTIRDLEKLRLDLTTTVDDQQAAVSRAEDERAAAKLEVARLGAELSAFREAAGQHQAALTETQALLTDRSATLATLERSHGEVVAERGRLLGAVADLEARIAAGEARQTVALAAIEFKTRAHAELAVRIAGQERTLAQLNDDLGNHKALLARCLEQLQTRESYRSVYETNLHELDVELDGARTRIAALAPHANTLESRVAELSAQITAHRTTIADLESAAVNQATLLATRDAALEATERLLTARNETVEKRGRDVDAALAEIERAHGVHAAAVESGAAALAEHARARVDAEARIVTTTQERDGAFAQLQSLQTSLSTAADEARAQREAIVSAHERTRELVSQVSDHETQAAAAAVELGQARAALSEFGMTSARQQALLAEHGRELAEHQAAATRTIADRDAQVQVIAALREEIARLNSRLVAPETERRSLEERAAALAQELATSEARALRLERVNEELRSTAQQLTRSLTEREAELHRVTRIASTSTYALGRVQSSIDGLGSPQTAADGDSGASRVGMLTRIDGDHHQDIVLRSRQTIGRDAENDIQLQARFVSRRHAAIIPGHGSALVEDLRSTNGVIVNGRRVRCARLTPGDVITLGTARFRYTLGSTADKPVPAGPSPLGTRVNQ